jgi:uncharacterized protein YaaR (DUF327 family)
METFSQWQDEVTKQFYLDNYAAIPKFMEKLGGESVSAITRNNMSYLQDRMNSEAVNQMMLQQIQDLHKKNQELLNVVNVMNGKLDSLTHAMMKISGSKIYHGTLTDPGTAPMEEPGPSPMEDLGPSPMEDPDESMSVANYSLIHSRLKQIRSKLGRCILYFWVEKADMSFRRLTSEDDKKTFKGIHCRRKKFFTPFIDYAIKKMGGEESSWQALNTNDGRQRAHKLLQDVLAMVLDHLIEKKLLKEGTKRLTITEGLRQFGVIDNYISGLE